MDKPLNLAEVISNLQDAYERYGNIPVYIQIDDFLYENRPVLDVQANETGVILYDY